MRVYVYRGVLSFLCVVVFIWCRITQHIRGSVLVCFEASFDVCVCVQKIEVMQVGHECVRLCDVCASFPTVCDFHPDFSGR